MRQTQRRSRRCVLPVWAVVSLLLLVTANAQSRCKGVIPQSIDLGCLTPGGTDLGGLVASGPIRNTFPDDKQPPGIVADLLDAIFFPGIDLIFEVAGAGGASAAAREVLSDQSSTRQVAPFPNVCFGDFTGEEIKTPVIELGPSKPFVENKCAQLPLLKNQDEWSVFGVTFTIPGTSTLCSIPGTQVVPGKAGTTISGCLALNLCDGLPSVAAVISGSIIECIASRSAATNPTSALIFAAAKTVGFASIGFSPTAKFSVDLVAFSGTDLVSFDARANLFVEVVFKLKPSDFGVPEKVGKIIQLDARGLSGIQVDTPEVEAFGDLIQAGVPLDGVFDLLKDFNAKAFLNGRATLKLKFSHLVIGKILPDSPTVDLAESTVFLSSSSQQTDGETLAPGFYAFAGASSPTVVVKLVAEYVLAIAGSILSILPDLPLVDLSVADLINGIDLSGLASNSPSAGVGFTVNTDNSAFLFKAPVGIAIAQVTVTIQCKTDFDKLTCKADADGFESAFDVVLDGVVWVAKQGERIVGAVIDGVEGAFTKENMKIAAKFIGDNLEDFGEELFEWADNADVLLEPVEKIAEIATEGVKRAKKGFEDAVDEVEGIVNGAGDTFEDAVDAVRDFRCSRDRVIRAAKLDTAICGPLNAAGQAITGAANDVVKAARDFFKSIAGFDPTRALSAIFGSVSRVRSTSDKDEFGCRIQKFEKGVKLPFGGKCCFRTRARAPLASCLEDAFKRAQTVIGDGQLLASAEAERDRKKVMFENELVEASLTPEILQNSGFGCHTTWDRSNRLAAGNQAETSLPLTMTCYPPLIRDGRLIPSTNGIMHSAVVENFNNAKQVNSAAKSLRATLDQAVESALGDYDSPLPDCQWINFGRVSAPKPFKDFDESAVVTGILALGSKEGPSSLPAEARSFAFGRDVENSYTLNAGSAKTCSVQLGFVENFFRNAGDRVFSATVTGSFSHTEKDIDVIAEVGRNKVLSKRFVVEPDSDGKVVVTLGQGGLISYITMCCDAVKVHKGCEAVNFGSVSAPAPFRDFDPDAVTGRIKFGGNQGPSALPAEARSIVFGDKSDFSYTLNAEDGAKSCRVEVGLVENAFQGPVGKRRFSISAVGKTTQTLDDIDVFALVGFNRLYSKTLTVAPDTSGKVRIDFDRIVQNPIVAYIRMCCEA